MSEEELTKKPELTEELLGDLKTLGIGYRHIRPAHGNELTQLGLARPVQGNYGFEITEAGAARLA